MSARRNISRGQFGVPRSLQEPLDDELVAQGYVRNTGVAQGYTEDSSRETEPGEFIHDDLIKLRHEEDGGYQAESYAADPSQGAFDEGTYKGGMSPGRPLSHVIMDLEAHYKRNPGTTAKSYYGAQD